MPPARPSLLPPAAASSPRFINPSHAFILLLASGRGAQSCWYTKTCYLGPSTQLCSCKTEWNCIEKTQTDDMNADKRRCSGDALVCPVSSHPPVRARGCRLPGFSTAAGVNTGPSYGVMEPDLDTTAVNQPQSFTMPGEGPFKGPLLVESVYLCLNGC